MIKILATKANTKLGKMITYFTKGKYSHVAIMIDDVIYESAMEISKYFELKNGIFCRRPGKTENQQIDFYSLNFEVDIYQKQKMINFCIDHIGRRYNVMMLITLFFIYPLKKWFNKNRTKIPFKDDLFGWICTEFVFDVVFEGTGKKLNNKIDKNILSPDDITNSDLLTKD